jgi:Mg/Co/Ni transporter MgtE
MYCFTERLNDLRVAIYSKLARNYTTKGTVRINDLFADGERPIGKIMEPEHEAVRYEDDQEEIAVLAMQLNMDASSLLIYFVLIGAFVTAP